MFSSETVTPVYFNMQHTFFLGVGNLIECFCGDFVIIRRVELKG